MSSIFAIPTAPNKLFRGDTIIIDGVISKDGSTLDLTGWKVWATFKKAEADADGASTTIQKSSPSSGVTIVDAPTGVIQIQIDPADTALLTVETTYIGDIQIKKTATGEIYTVAKGTLTISIDITQATS